MAGHDDFTPMTLGMLAHVVNELAARVGLLSAHVVKDEKIRKEMDDAFVEIHALASRIASKFPPPPDNGTPGRAH